MRVRQQLKGCSMKSFLFLFVCLALVASASSSARADMLKNTYVYCESGEPSGGGSAIGISVDMYRNKQGGPKLSKIDVRYYSENTGHWLTKKYMLPRTVKPVEKFGRKMLRSSYQLSSRHALALYHVEGDATELFFVELIDRRAKKVRESLYCQMMTDQE